MKERSNRKQSIKSYKAPEVIKGVRVITVFIDSNTAFRRNPSTQEVPIEYREDVYQVTGASVQYYGNYSRYGILAIVVEARTA